MFIFGLGYTANRLADRLRSEGWEVNATGSAGNIDFDDERRVREAMTVASHILSSVPPNRKTGEDDALARYGTDLANWSGGWLGYLSSTGVYGNTHGAWIDESAATGTGRRKERAESDARWLELDTRVFRLPGIYGPGRSLFDRIEDGRAHRIDMPGQVFSRIHVDDIVSGVIAGLDGPPGAYNLADDLPASSNAVTEEACRLLGMELPPLQTMEEADLSPMARGFYAENRRVANGKAKRVLGWQPAFPTYREGLRAILAGL